MGLLGHTTSARLAIKEILNCVSKAETLLHHLHSHQRWIQDARGSASLRELDVVG